MKAITVRDSGGKLICFGPDNGMYDPSMNGKPAGAVKTVESDYQAVYDEFQITTRPDLLKQTQDQQDTGLEAKLDAILASPGLVAKLKDAINRKP